VDAGLELLARFLVNVRRAQHRIDGPFRRERYRAGNGSARLLRRSNNLIGRFVDQPVIVRFQLDPYLLSNHDELTPSFNCDSQQQEFRRRPNKTKGIALFTMPISHAGRACYLAITP